MKAVLVPLGLALGVPLAVTACAHAPRPFPLRDPLATDTDVAPVSVACRPDPSPKEPRRMACAPREYTSPFVRDRIDNIAFAPGSRLFSVDVAGEAANANSLDEVADSAWFENRRVRPTAEQLTMGACKPEDLLPAEAADGAWIIDHGKDNGATPGFRVTIPGKGQYLLKADNPQHPELASAASAIGAALYHAVGYPTSCEQVVLIKRSQLQLTPGLVSIDNENNKHPFDDAALQKVLADSSHVGDLTRMQASKWLPGYTIGPFRYEHTREDDPNDIIAHENRRELRGNRVLAAWLNHWDSREQNTMDVWMAVDAKNKRSSPGYVRHYMLDTSEAFGGGADPDALTIRLGFSYIVDFGDIAFDLLTVGLVSRPWDRTHQVKGREKFGLFSAQDFDPPGWKGLYPNPAFVRMQERDAAWMARILARFSADDVRALVAAGRFSDPSDADYLTQILLERQRRILARYLTKLSPLADVHADLAQICATDLARLRGVVAPDQLRYTVVQRSAGKQLALEPAVQPDGVVCFKPQPVAPAQLPDTAAERLVIFEVRNGTAAGPLEIHAYDLDARGMRVVGLVRPAP
ncbi:MAG: hypothetical protein ABIY55_35635 [Kofleriaceae bacterium]